MGKARFSKFESCLPEELLLELVAEHAVDARRAQAVASRQMSRDTIANSTKRGVMKSTIGIAAASGLAAIFLLASCLHRPSHDEHPALAGMPPAPPKEQPVLVTNLGHVRGVGSVAFSLDGRFLLSGSGDENACLWDFIKGAEIRRFRQHTGGILYARFGKNQREVFTGDEEGWLRRWDGSTELLQSEFKGFVGQIGHGYSHGAPFANSPDGLIGFVATEDGIGHLSNTITKQSIGTLALGLGEVGYAQFTPNGRILIVAGSEGTIALRTADHATIWRTPGHGPIAVSGDGKQVILSGEPNNFAELRSTETGTIGATLPIDSAGIFAFALSRTGALAITARYPGVVDVWNVATGKKLDSRKYQNNVSALAFSPDDLHFVVADWDGTVKVFHSDPVELERTLSGSVSEVHWIGFTGTSLRILASDYRSGTAYYWNTTSNAPVTTLLGHPRPHYIRRLVNRRPNGNHG